jgi:HCOMODA/2-hydroxy-3-carboxy-muconic semialdehyde decarboxylase
MAGTDPAELRKDFIAAMRIIHQQGLCDAYGHLSARANGGREMLFMGRQSPALVTEDDLFVVDFEKPVPQSAVHQAVYKAREDVQAVAHFHSPGVIALTVVGETVRPMHNYSVIFYEGVPVWKGTGQVETPERAAEIVRVLGSAKAVLLPGHGAVVVGGSIPEVCLLSIFLEESARLQAKVMKLGTPTYLSAEEAQRMATRTFKPTSVTRGWEHYRARAGL